MATRRPNGVLTIDAGNTSMRFALVRNGRAKLVWRGDSATLSQKAPHPALPLLESLPLLEGVCCAIGRPVWRAGVERLVSRIDQLPALFFIDHHGPLPFKVRYRAKATAGPDRIANIAGMLKLYCAPAICVDFGTATNIDVLGAEGNFEGGAILPGVGIAMSALARATAGRLPDLAPKLPTTALGRSTEECMLSGGVLGHVLAVEGLIGVMRDENPEFLEAPVVLTGGMAGKLAEAFAIPVVHEPMLTMIGIASIWESVGRMHAKRFDGG